MASELAVHGEQWLLANKLSLNSLQDRLACASQLSLKRVIASNLVVNSGAKLGKFRLMPRFWHEIAFSSSSLVRYSTAILAFFCWWHCGVDTSSPERPLRIS
jgi:hypothetical protein